MYNIPISQGNLLFFKKVFSIGFFKQHGVVWSSGHLFFSTSVPVYDDITLQKPAAYRIYSAFISVFNTGIVAFYDSIKCN